jgi:hypothetical protein
MSPKQMGSKPAPVGSPEAVESFSQRTDDRLGTHSQFERRKSFEVVRRERPFSNWTDQLERSPAMSASIGTALH